MPLEGKSLRPILETGSRDAHEALYWEHQGNRAIRQGRWKLVALRDRATQAAKPWELYDIAEDRSEQHDLAAEMPERVAAMEAAWLKWGEKVGWVPFEQLR